MQEESLSIRTKIENRSKQLKKKLRGYVYVNYTKGNNPKPKHQPDFPETTAASLVELYSEYETIDYGSTMGQFFIPPFRSKPQSSYHENNLDVAYSDDFMDSLYYLTKHRQVLYHKETHALYLYDNEYSYCLVPLNLDIKTYLDWLIFFLGIDHFEYLFVNDTTPYTELIKVVNQKLNCSFYKDDIIPSWFEQSLPPSIKIHPDLTVGDRVQTISYELSGVITAIKKTKATVVFDAGGVGPILLRMVVRVNDNLYEDLIHGRKQLLTLTPLEYKTLAEILFPRYSYRTVEDYRHISEVHKVKKIYTNLILTDVFKSSFLVLAALRTFVLQAKNQHIRIELEYAMHFVWLGMYLTCHDHLKRENSPNLSQALGSSLSQQLDLYLNAFEQENSYLYQQSLLPYFKKAMNNFSLADFDYLKIEEMPLGFFS